MVDAEREGLKRHFRKAQLIMIGCMWVAAFSYIDLYKWHLINPLIDGMMLIASLFLVLLSLYVSYITAKDL